MKPTLWTVALLPMLCTSCGGAERHTTFAIECLRYVENHTRAAQRVEAARQACGTSFRAPGRG